MPLDSANEPTAYVIALRRLRRGQYSQALPLLQRLSFGRHDKSKYLLAMMHFHGLYLDQDYKKAHEILKQLPRPISIPYADYYLGVYYELGLIGPKDLPQAFIHYLAAAKAGVTEAQIIAAGMLLTGDAVERDHQLALKLYKMAAKQNSYQAMFNLGLVYERGFMVKPDLPTAISWYKKAAKGNDVNAFFRLGSIYQDSNDIKLAQSAEGYLQAASKLGNMDAALALGNYYLSGKSGEPNPSKAMTAYMLAAEGGREEAYLIIGKMYEDGVGMESDPTIAAKWYSDAAELGYEAGFYNLATLYQTGKGVEKNTSKAQELLKQAADLGYQPAIDRLANEKK